MLPAVNSGAKPIPKARISKVESTIARRAP